MQNPRQNTEPPIAQLAQAEVALITETTVPHKRGRPPHGPTASAEEGQQLDGNYVKSSSPPSKKKRGRPAKVAVPA